jgi:hypothetical protein
MGNIAEAGEAAAMGNTAVVDGAAVKGNKSVAGGASSAINPDHFWFGQPLKQSLAYIARVTTNTFFPSKCGVCKYAYYMYLYPYTNTRIICIRTRIRNTPAAPLPIATAATCSFRDHEKEEATVMADIAVVGGAAVMADIAVVGRSSVMAVTAVVGGAAWCVSEGAPPTFSAGRWEELPGAPGIARMRWETTSSQDSSWAYMEQLKF